ncbi:MAG: hypothetical protein K0S70_3965, partial [Microbacterium sp.]|nr:hypothetical protein [Microbacterium sp.]
MRPIGCNDRTGRSQGGFVNDTGTPQKA